MEILLILLFTPFIILFALIITSKGECYFCGYKFKEGEVVLKTQGDKTCRDCYAQGRYRGDRR